MRKLVIILFLLPNILLGQSTPFDMLILQDSSRIVGNILEEVDGAFLFKLISNEEKIIERSNIKEVIENVDVIDISSDVKAHLDKTFIYQSSDLLIDNYGDTLYVHILKRKGYKITYVNLEDPLMEERIVSSEHVEIIYRNKEYLQRENVLSDKRKAALKQNYYEASNYPNNKTQTIELNGYALNEGSLMLAYEREINRKYAWEFSAFVHGIREKDIFTTRRGFGIQGGYKIKIGSFLTKNYVTENLLQGTYLTPLIGFTSVNERSEQYFSSNSFRLQNSNRNYGFIGFDLGYQLVIDNVIIFDFYSGLTYFNGDFDVFTNNNGNITISESSIISDADHFGSENIGLKFGIKLGFAFGKRKDEKAKRKNKKNRKK